MTASAIYMKFADKNGLVSLADLKSVGWTKEKAENEGIIVKETFYCYDMDSRKSEVKGAK